MPVRLPDFSVVTEGEWCKSAGHFDLDPEEVREVIAAAMSCTLHDVQALDGVHPARRATLARVHSTLLTRAHTVGSLSIRYSSLQLAMDSDCSEKSIRGALDDLAELGWNRTKGGIVGDSVTCTIWTWEPVGTFAPRAHVARHGALLKVLGATGESGAKVSVTEVGNALAVGLRRRDGDLAGCGAYTAHALDFILQNPDGVDERMLTEHLGVVPQTSRRKLSRFALRGIVVATTKATGGRPSFWYTWSADTAAIVRASKIGERVIRNYQAAIDVSRWRMGQAKALAKRLGCTLAVALARLGERIDTVIKGIRSWARVRKGDQAPVQLSARGEFRANMRARAPSLAA